MACSPASAGGDAEASLTALHAQGLGDESAPRRRTPPRCRRLRSSARASAAARSASRRRCSASLARDRASSATALATTAATRKTPSATQCALLVDREPARRRQVEEVERRRAQHGRHQPEPEPPVASTPGARRAGRRPRATRQAPRSSAGRRGSSGARRTRRRPGRPARRAGGCRPETAGSVLVTHAGRARGEATRPQRARRFAVRARLRQARRCVAVSGAERVLNAGSPSTTTCDRTPNSAA